MLWWEMESWPTKKWGIGEKRLRTPALDKLQQVFMKTQLGMSVCLIKILTDTKESHGTGIYSSLTPTGV